MSENVVEPTGWASKESPSKFEPPRSRALPLKVLRLASLIGLAILRSGAATGAPPAPAAQEGANRDSAPEENRRWRICWEQRPLLENPSGRYRFEFGGTLQADFAGFAESADFQTSQGSLLDGGEWRRAAVYLHGSAGSEWEYRFQYDFALRNPPHLKDAYVQWTGLPFAIMLGRFRTPLGLESYTSGADLTFMERSLTNAFFPSRNTGVLLLGASRKYPVGWSFGIIQSQSDFLIKRFDRIGVSARAARAFRFADDQMLHMGLNFQLRKVEDFFRYLERPESHLAPQFADTWQVAAHSGRSWLVESAWMKGPFSVQGEAAISAVNGDATRSQPDVRFHGYYLFVSWFLTGEQRSYSERENRFRAAVPRRVVGEEKGWGAWETALRFSNLDLTDRNIRGGEMSSISWALNWYLTRFSRVQFNLIRATSGLFDHVWIHQVRLQLAF